LSSSTTPVLGIGFGSVVSKNPPAGAGIPFSELTSTPIALITTPLDVVGVMVTPLKLPAPNCVPVAFACTSSGDAAAPDMSYRNSVELLFVRANETVSCSPRLGVALSA
jgi:hypothetical protein